MTKADVIRLLPTLGEQKRERLWRFILEGEPKAPERIGGRPVPVIFHNPLGVCEGGDDDARCEGAKRQFLDIPRNVVALVHYRWMREKFGQSKSFSVPSGMQGFVEQELRRVMRTLPDACRARVDEYHAFIGESEGYQKVLWVRVDHTGKRIVLSPLFVRTVFMYVAPPSSAWFEHLKGLYQRKERPSWEVEKLLDRFLEQFATQLRFILAHELAHVYRDEPSETECDRLAFLHLRAQGEKVEFGALQTILGEAIRVGRADLWGFDARSSDKINEITHRLALLSELQQDSSLPAAPACPPMQ